MRRSVCDVLLVIFFLNSASALAATVNGTNHLTISDNSITSLYAYDTASVQVVNGGDLPFYYGYNSTSLGMLGGSSVSYVNLFDQAIVAMSADSNASYVNLANQASAQIQSGATISHFSAYNTSQASILGGTFSFLNLLDNSHANISSVFFNGGLFIGSGISVDGGALTYAPGASADVYVQQAVFSNGMLSGTWEDGTNFSFWVISRLLDGNGNEYFELPNTLPQQITLHQTAVVPLGGSWVFFASGLAALFAPLRKAGKQGRRLPGLK